MKLCQKCAVVWIGPSSCPVCLLEEKIESLNKALADAVHAAGVDLVKRSNADDLTAAVADTVASGNAMRTSLDQLESEYERATKGRTEEEAQAEENGAQEVVEIPEEKAKP